MTRSSDALTNSYCPVVILCTEGDCNLLVVEGGPRGIRKLTRLVLERIKWSEKIQAKEGKQPELGLEEESVDGDMSDDDDKEEEQEDYSKQMPDNASQSSYCRLVWRGIIPKRIFTGFKFQVFDVFMPFRCHYYMDSLLTMMIRNARIMWSRGNLWKIKEWLTIGTWLCKRVLKSKATYVELEIVLEN